MNAQQTLNLMVNEHGRNAVLRSELLERAGCSASSCDRALRRSCTNGILVRVGHGIYGVGNARVFGIVPEVMPKLGYQISPAHQVSGYSQKSSGSVWFVNKPCKRKIRRKGVHAFFQAPSGKVLNEGEEEMSLSQPTPHSIEDHYHTFEHCHSLARAEKDLIALRALDVLDAFQDDRAQLAMQGGTALAYYYREITRFSEDLDVRLVLRSNVLDLPFSERAGAVKAVGERLRTHIGLSLPFIGATNKGRIRQDGVVQSFIFDYEPIEQHDEVIPGLKIELVHVPLLCDLDRNPYRSENSVPVVDLVEIAAGKWQALAVRLPERGDSYPDLVRHIHDLSSLLPTLNQAKNAFCRAARRGAVTNETISHVVNEVNKHAWKDHYTNYMRRMGTAVVADRPGCHPTWSVVSRRFSRTAELLLEAKVSREDDREQDRDWDLEP